MSTRAVTMLVCTLGASLGASLAACGDGESHAGSDAPEARRLVGEWTATFEGTPVRLLHPDGAHPVRVSGTLALLPNHAIARFGAIELPTNVGSYDVSFSPMGFEPRDYREAPTVAARAWGADSVELMLGSNAHRPGVFMQGVWAGDSLAGRWTLYSSRAVSASGTFVLRRQRAH
jgi:hypothetical protein